MGLEALYVLYNFNYYGVRYDERRYTLSPLTVSGSIIRHLVK